MGKRRNRKFCKRTWETRIFPWKNSELIFFSSGGSCHLCLQTGHCKKHDVYADASQINFGETELEHLNIYKSIFVKQNLDIWTFTNPFLWNGIWADLKELHLLKLLRTRWMERRGDRFRNHQHLNILWWSWEIKTDNFFTYVCKKINLFYITNPISPLQTIGQSMELELLPNPGFVEGGTDQSIGSYSINKFINPGIKTNTP